MLAHAFLAVATAIERDHAPVPAGLIELTVNEFRRLFGALLLSAKHSIDTLLAWSRWPDDIKPTPATATTDDAHTNDHDLRLQY